MKVDTAESILAKNLDALMRARPLLNTQQAVADATKRAGQPIDQKTVSRILNAEVSVQLDTVQAIAAAFDVEPYQLLVPDFDPANPQLPRILSPAEERLLQALDDARKGLQ
jgi:transcriptional regulator with XRE-family HTH domain